MAERTDGPSWHALPSRRSAHAGRLRGGGGGGGENGGGTAVTVGPTLNFSPSSNVTCSDGLVIQLNASFPQPFAFQGAGSAWSLTISAGAAANQPTMQPGGSGVVTTATVRVGAVTGPMRFVRMRISYQNGFGAFCCSVEQVGPTFTPQPNADTTVTLNFPSASRPSRRPPTPPPSPSTTRSACRCWRRTCRSRASGAATVARNRSSTPRFGRRCPHRARTSVASAATAGSCRVQLPVRARLKARPWIRPSHAASRTSRCWPRVASLRRKGARSRNAGLGKRKPCPSRPYAVCRPMYCAMFAIDGAHTRRLHGPSLRETVGRWPKGCHEGRIYTCWAHRDPRRSDRRSTKTSGPSS